MIVINPNLEDANRLNFILTSAYVFDENGNYKAPFSTGTTQYLNVSLLPWEVDDVLAASVNDAAISAEDRAFIATLLAAQYNYTPPPIPGAP